MSKTNNGGPAFPVPETGPDGMTMRDYFAGQALVGLLAGQETTDPKTAAKYAVQYADALLAELEGKS